MTQPSLFEKPATVNPPDICKNLHRGNRQSQAANRATSPRKKSMRLLILEWFASKLEPMTCKDAEIALGIRHQTAGARLAELKKAGLIIDTGKTRATSSGCMAALLKAKEE